MPNSSELADKSLAYDILVLILAFLGNLSAGLIATLMATYLPDVVLDLTGSADPDHVSRVGSWVGSLFLVGWSIGGISLGWLGDRLGRIRSLAISVFISGLFTLISSWVDDWILLIILRFLAGIGVGATMVLTAVLVAEAWGSYIRGRSIAISIVAVAFPIGIITSGLVQYLVQDWRTAFLLGSIPVILAVCYQFILKEPSQWVHVRKISPISSEKSNELGRLLDPDLRFRFLIAATIFGAMLIGIWATFSWLPTWAQSLVPDGLSGQAERGTVMILLGMGGIVGCIIGGFLANSWGRKRSLLIAFSGAFIASSILFWSNSVFTPVIYLETAFLAIFFGISQGILTAYIPELFPVQVRSTATGICFNAGRLLTAAAVYFLGVLVPLMGGYGNAFLIFSLTYLIGFIVTLFGEETKGKVL